MKILNCCKLNLMQLRIQPKYLLVFVYFVIHTWRYIHPYKEFAIASGLKVAPWLLVGLVRHQNWYMFFMMAYLLLICDAPFLNRQQQFVLLRSGKINWLAGQILYLAILSALVTLLTWVLSVVALLPEVDWTTQWGAAIQTASRYPEAYSVTPQYTIIGYALKNMTGMGATLWALLMQFLVGLFLGELVLVCNLWSKRGLGIGISAAMLFFSLTVAQYAGSRGYVKRLVYISPLSWMDLAKTGDTAVGQPPLWYCITMLLILIVGLAVFALRNIHKHSLDMYKE